MLQVESHEGRIPEIHIVGMMRITKAYPPMPMETHSGMYELFYLQTGEKQMIVRDRHYLMHGGDMLVIPPDIPHGNESAVQNRSSMVYVIFSDPSKMKGFLSLSQEERDALTEKLNKVRCTHASQMVRQHMESLLECVSQDGDDIMFASARLRSLFFLLLDAVTDARQSENPEISDDIRAVVDYIGEHPMEMPELSALCEIAGISETHFKQKFKQFMGMPPAEYIARQHISMAEDMLRRTDMGIGEIARELGFASGQHFARLFKRYKGQTPSSYRAGEGLAGRDQEHIGRQETETASIRRDVL